MQLSQHSVEKLAGVHPDLVKIATAAIVTAQFIVVYGVRTVAEEAAMVAKGASQTMHSRHLPNRQGLACAIDIAALHAGAVDWVHIPLYQQVHTAMMTAAAAFKIPLEWGGDWTTLKDWGHYQLPWKDYP